jgi:hypothetical protein
MVHVQLNMIFVANLKEVVQRNEFDTFTQYFHVLVAHPLYDIAGC